MGAVHLPSKFQEGIYMVQSKFSILGIGVMVRPVSPGLWSPGASFIDAGAQAPRTGRKCWQAP